MNHCFNSKKKKNNEKTIPRRFQLINLDICQLDSDLYSNTIKSQNCSLQWVLPGEAHVPHFETHWYKTLKFHVFPWCTTVKSSKINVKQATSWTCPFFHSVQNFLVYLAICQNIIENLWVWFWILVLHAVEILAKSRMSLKYNTLVISTTLIQKPAEMIIEFVSLMPHYPSLNQRRFTHNTTDRLLKKKNSVTSIVNGFLYRINVLYIFVSMLWRVAGFLFSRASPTFFAINYQLPSS